MNSSINRPHEATSGSSQSSALFVNWGYVTMASKRKKKSTILSLEECTKRLEALPNFSALDFKEAGELYASSIALLYHLSVDQDAIFRTRSSHRKSTDFPEPSFPKPNEIPAMTAVVHNQSLFQSLVSCLKTTTACPEASSTSSSSSHSALYASGARKRQHSIDLSSTAADGSTNNNTSNKSAKLTPGQSPHIGKRIVNPTSKNSSNPSNQSKQQQQQQQNQRPEMNIRIVAATILYVALEPLDHWPVALIEAYAEDSFGARSWVDDPACQPLVQNLKLVHSITEGADTVVSIQDEGLEAEAVAVAEFNAVQNESLERSPTTSPPPGREEPKRRGSLSSTASGDAMPLVTSLMRGRSESFGSVSGVSQTGSTTTSPTSQVRKKNGQKWDGGSDAGDDAEVAVATFNKMQSCNGDDGSSSSSGEDEEVFIEEISVDGSDLGVGDLNPKASPPDRPPPALVLTYPVRPKSLKYLQTRQRFFGLNMEYAHHAVAAKLEERLDIKSKQNSGLLQCLPSFTTIPNVRSLVTANLEKWFQSPALSGLARNLFSLTVKNMKNVDPPLQEDVDSLDNILSMRLKSNQLNCHIENLTAVATTMPTAAVANHMYSHLLGEILQSVDGADSANSEHLSMIEAVHGVLPRELQAVGLAKALVGMLIQPPEQLEYAGKPKLVRKICTLIRSLYKRFGKSFDPYDIMKEILSISSDVGTSWTMEDEENKGRILFQFAILSADYFATKMQTTQDGRVVVDQTEEDMQSLRGSLTKTRQLMLLWCCRDYAPMLSLSGHSVNGNHSPPLKAEKGNDIIGAGPANFSSVLDGLNEEDVPNWLNIVRCVLFMETSASVKLQTFLSPDGHAVESDQDWADTAKRIDLCCDYGADLDNATVWFVLERSIQGENPMPRDAALLVLENLFYCCQKDRKSRLFVDDSNLLWELYELVEYVPSPRSGDNLPGGVRDAERGEKRDTEIVSLDRTVPRLAYAGMWWRVTGIALIISGNAPNTFGTVAWEQHPTLAALIKMVTSDRYRFPTVDCDDVAREDQKRTEQSMREEEAKIAEKLFLSPKKPKKKQTPAAEVSHQGSRASRRQQEKRDKMLEKQREKEKAEERAEASRRKKLLRAAQKSITLLDPKRGPRKPPRESADLIFSVGELFDLPRVFQKNVEPDFVLSTIGSTTRSAIERAYDWLIPIISCLPETISRLPASASCFLLLRAYGTQGEERSELQTLSAPLLQHVYDSLIGKFGEVDAVRAFDLLFSDLSSHKPDRRRCARRVLQNAVGKEEIAMNDPPFSGSNHAWVSTLTRVQHAERIVEEAVNKLTIAATFERGSNLRFLVLALNKLTTFAKSKELSGDWEFGALLIRLISQRPAVFASALIAFSNLCSLVVKTILDQYQIAILAPESTSDTSDTAKVEVSLCRNPFDRDTTKATVPLTLLKSSCVMLSVWVPSDLNSGDSDSISVLSDMLLKSLDAESFHDCGPEATLDGLASAMLVGMQENIVPVEYWVMVAKSRSDVIAKRAALSAPLTFLPRLLLCSGLPRASLLTMVDRLGKLGEKSPDVEKEFCQLLTPSASSEWDIARLGNRKEMYSRLHGRVSAYFRLYGVDTRNVNNSISLVFYEWLSSACHPKEKSTKAKKAKSLAQTTFESMSSAAGLLSQLSQGPLNGSKSKAPGEVTHGMTTFLPFEGIDRIRCPERLNDDQAMKRFFKEAFEAANAAVLEDWLSLHFEPSLALTDNRKRRRKPVSMPESRLEDSEVAILLLECFVEVARKCEGMASSVLAWIPRLSVSSGSPRLWMLLFSEGQKPSILWNNLLSRCMQSWNHDHIVCCRTWLLSGGNVESLDLSKTVLFLVGSSTFQGIHIECFTDFTVPSEDSAWARSEESVRTATRISIDCLMRSASERRLRSRDDIPETLVLLVLMAKFGRKQIQFISEALMERLPDQSSSIERCILLSLLRLYAYLPFSMNLGAAALRSNLTKAVELCAEDWLSWRSPFDDALQDMLRFALESKPSEQRSAQNLLDAAKKHPLLALRKLDRIAIALDKDAIASTQSVNEAEAKVSSQPLEGPIEATSNGKSFVVQVKHWGYNYTGSSWMLILDVLAAVPQEVLFGCAVKMGLTTVLDLYLQLIHVQSQLHSDDRLSLLKERFSRFLGTFKASKSPHWEAWLGSPMTQLPSSGAVRNTLLSCGLMSHEEALESVKKAHSLNDVK